MDVHPEFLDEAMRILRIEEANEHAAEVLGATKPSDLVGPVDHTFKADRDAFRRNLIARFSSAEIYSEERRRIRPDGSTADVLYTSTFSPALNEL
jgi:PAS domain-containing protein